MIVVAKEKCAGCGLCANICHEQCIALVGANGRSVPQVDHALCSTCTQCIAICPRRALSWDRVVPVAYDDPLLPAPEQLAELLKQRRTVRRFRPEKLDRALVEEIVGYGIYAPTNNYELRAIVVDDPKALEALDAIIMRFVSRIYGLFFKSDLVFAIAAAITPAASPKLRVKLARSLERERASDALPPAVVFIVGDRRVPLSEASAQYALYNMILYAQAKGVGSRINAAGSITLDRSRAARAHQGLRKHEHILATLELGYPAVRFRNKVEGKTMGIQWNGRRADG